MASRETVFTKEVLKRHGARPDLRIWRNETAGAWVGKMKGRTPSGDVVLRKGARMIQAGLCKGSADLIGLTSDGRFIALELKVGRDRLRKDQAQFLKFIESFGGIAGSARTMEEVDQILGVPPGESDGGAEN